MFFLKRKNRDCFKSLFPGFFLNANVRVVSGKFLCVYYSGTFVLKEKKNSFSGILYLR